MTPNADRSLRIGAAQLGPIARSEPRASVVARMIALLRQAAERGAQLVVFPELAFTTFFPRWFIADEHELDAFYETEMPGPRTQPLFDAARALAVGISVGYAERVIEDGRIRRFNTAILVDATGRLVGKYRKIHLPGHFEYEPAWPFQHLEKRYFETGDLGFPVSRAFGGVVGLAICNDRRWPETWRMLSLQGAELVLVGFNTPAKNPDAPEQDRLADFHHRLVVQAGAYQNACWAVAVAKAGLEEGVEHIGGTLIVAPSGEIVAECASRGDEVVVADCDLDATAIYRSTVFDFARHREPAQYRLIAERKGIVPPP